MSDQRIKVLVRVRPPTPKEDSIVQFPDTNTIELDTHSFSFDHVLPPLKSQAQFYSETGIHNTVMDLMNGYNGTVLAYGQTGSGKSYTMMGNEKNPGVIPRIVESVFSEIGSNTRIDSEFMVKVSYLEIYMERIRDLLDPSKDNLPIHEEKSRGVYVKDLTEEYVGSIEEIYQLLEKGTQARAVSSTNMNQESSRSHSIFTLTVNQKNTITGTQRSGHLRLVDLAGSEKVGKTGAVGQTLEEAKKINKSLSALGMVINSLTSPEGSKLHVPYRDSKLTRILQESLGGNSRTSLIVNCAPSSFNLAETLSSLRFGERAKGVKNKAKVNTELSPAELKQMLAKSQAQLTAKNAYAKKLESELVGWRNGNEPSKESWVGISLDLPPSPVRKGHRHSASFVHRSKTITTTPATDLMKRRHRNSVHESFFKPETQYSVDELLERENQLQDQVTERDNVIAEQEKVINQLRDQLKEQKDGRQELERQFYELKEKTVHENNSNRKVDKILESYYTDLFASDKKQIGKSLEMAYSLITKLNIENDHEVDYVSKEISSAILQVQQLQKLSPVEKLVLDNDRRFREYISTKLDDNESIELSLYHARLKSLNDLITTLQSPSSQEDTDNERVHTMQKEFEDMKESLMRDLQDRCERVIELEISLDQAKESLSKTSPANDVVSPMTVTKLEKTVATLTQQNTDLRRDLDMAQRIMEMRNDRITGLENSLKESGLEHRQAESKLSALRTRLVDFGPSAVTSSSAIPNGNGSNGTSSYRIVKPIRGGIERKEGTIWTKINSFVNLSSP